MFDGVLSYADIKIMYKKYRFIIFLIQFLNYDVRDCSSVNQLEEGKKKEKWKIQRKKN